MLGKLWPRPPALNFLRSGRQRPWTKRRLLRWLTGLAIGLGVLAVWLVPPTWVTLKATGLYRRHLTRAQHLLVAQRFPEARAELERAEGSLADARSAFRWLTPIAAVPWLGNNVQAGQQLLAVGQTIVEAARRVTDFGEQVLSPFQNKPGHLTFGGLSVAEREELLRRLGQAEPALRSLEQDIQSIVDQLERLPRSFVQRRVNRLLDPVRENLQLIEEALRRAAPIARSLPKLMGHQRTQVYLFLLQNNTELRPSGGFIGTYGVLKVRNGEIISFTTDNSYNLDDRVKGVLRIPAPEPLQLYNSTEHWFFRDANWSPDFREAAGETSNFYRREGGREQLDGVLGVTPTFIEALLKLTGPITVEGVTFTAETLVDTLQEQVTYGFYRRGVAQAQRKEIIGTMGRELMARLFALPQSDWQDLWLTILQQLFEKHLLFNFVDPDLQRFAEEQGWAGAVEPGAGDFLMVVDANLGSLKTDPRVRRTIRYELNAEGNQWKATATITYANEGGFTKKTTRYRTYVRVYVPPGSQLDSSDGADLLDRSDQPGRVTTSQELGKTVFGSFKSIEPGTTETLTLRYTLPTSLASELQQRRYQLLVQKQAGTINHRLDLRLTFPRPARLTDGIDRLERGAHTLQTIETDLRRDRAFRFHLNP